MGPAQERVTTICCLKGRVQERMARVQERMARVQERMAGVQKRVFKNEQSNSPP